MSTFPYSQEAEDEVRRQYEDHEALKGRTANQWNAVRDAWLRRTRSERRMMLEAAWIHDERVRSFRTPKPAMRSELGREVEDAAYAETTTYI